MMLDKEHFYNAIDDIIAQMEIDSKNTKHLQAIYQHDYITGYDNNVLYGGMCKLLEHLMNDTENGWIGYFLYDLECGKNYKDGCVEEDGKIIPLANKEDLYNLLVGKV